MLSLVHYFYFFNYAALHLEGKAIGPLEFHTKMAILADKYDVGQLSSLATKKFKQEAQQSRFRTGNLEPVDLQDLANAATCAYDATDPTDEIRAEIVKLAITSKLLSTEREESEQNDFEKVVRARPELASDVAARVMSGLVNHGRVASPTEKRFSCPSSACNFSFIATMDEACTAIENGSRGYSCYKCKQFYPVELWQRRAWD